MSSSFDLAQLADLKAWLDLQASDDDALLARLVTQTSRTILSYLDRPMILPATYTETRDGGAETALILQQWPVVSITSCIVDGRSVPAAMPPDADGPPGAGFALEPAQQAPPGRMQQLALRGFCFRPGVQNIVITYRAGYQISGEMALVPFSAPYSVTAAAPYGDWAMDIGVSYANGAPLAAASSPPAAGQYNAAAGVYTFSAADAGAAIALTYGYIPADLSFCCLDWAAELYAYRGRMGQRSKSLGGQETSSFIVKDVPDFVASALRPFRRVVTP